MSPVLYAAAVQGTPPHKSNDRVPVLLGERHVTGDLTGLSRLRFDLPGKHPVRFRVVYRLAEDTVIEVLVIGERADHVVYRDTLARMT